MKNIIPPEYEFRVAKKTNLTCKKLHISYTPYMNTNFQGFATEKIPSVINSACEICIKNTINQNRNEIFKTNKINSVWLKKKIHGEEVKTTLYSVQRSS